MLELGRLADVLEHFGDCDCFGILEPESSTHANIMLLTVYKFPFFPWS